MTLPHKDYLVRGMGFLKQRTLARRMALGILGSVFILAFWQNPRPLTENNLPGEISDSTHIISPILTQDLSQSPTLFHETSLRRDSLAWQASLREYFNRVRQVKSLRDSVLVFAWRQRGTPYVWGGTAPGGFDCSGLLQFSFRRAGLIIPRTAASQATMGKAIPVDERWLAPGDLLVFQSHKSPYVDHIGMYIGHGQYIHASGGQRKVTIGSLRDPRDISNRILIGARRVFHLPYRQPNS